MVLPVLACTRGVISAVLQVYNTIPPKVLLEYWKHEKGTGKDKENSWKMYLQIFENKEDQHIASG